MVDITSLIGVRKVPSLNRRFWDSVEAFGECWIWTRLTKTGGGYGLFNLPVDSVRGSAWRKESVHRIVYEALHGPIPADREILHSCDRPPCLCPEHLRCGTRLENMTDKVDRGRQVRGGRVPGVSLPREDLPSRSGEGHHAATVSDAEIRWARERYAASQDTAAALGRVLGMSTQNMLRVLRGWTRAGAGGPISLIRPIVGARVAQALLDEARVLEILTRHGAGESQASLCRAFGVKPQAISKIVRRVAWKHVPYPGDSWKPIRMRVIDTSRPAAEE